MMPEPDRPPAALAFEGVTKTFPGVRALDNVSFDVRPGEVHALCGENGAGKSTLIKVLSGYWPAGSYDGTVRLDGAPAAFRSVRDASDAGVSVIYQELALVPEMSVAENVFLGHEPGTRGCIDHCAMHVNTEALLKQFGLYLGTDVPVSRLGVGEQQLVEIIKALSHSSRILLLDEPSAALSDFEVKVLLRIVKGLKSRGITCIYISHKLDEVFQIADRITVLRDGQSIVTLDTSDTTPGEVIRHMVGRDIDDLYPRRSTPRGDAILAATGLSVAHPRSGRPFVHDVSFSVHVGEVLGIGGLMGAGRTELLMHLAGAFGKRTAGEVLLNGEPYAPTTPGDAISQGVILVSEDRKRYGLHLDQDIEFNMSLASLERYVRAGGLQREPIIKASRTLFDQLGVRATGLGARVGRLSGGNQQKVVIGKALMTAPELVLLDEPTRGIDVGAKVEVYELINQLTADGKAVVMVSSELPELLGVCDRVLALSNGRVGGEFDPRTTSQEDVLKANMAFL